MRIKIIMFLISGICTAGVCFAQSDPNNTGLPMGSNSSSPKDTNNPNSTSVTAKMNGNSTAASGVDISSTSIGSEGRNTPNKDI